MKNCRSCTALAVAELSLSPDRHRDLAEDSLDAFFSQDKPQVVVFENRQLFDYDGLEGRLLSSSYTPEPGNPNYQPMLALLRDIFDRYQQGGKVAFEYDTMLYYGCLT